MQIGQRLKELGEIKKFSQGVIEQRTGLLRCYVSRVENEHTVPTVDTLEKWARALEVPLYKIFHEGDEPAEKPKRLEVGKVASLWGTSAKEWKELVLLSKALSKMGEHKRDLLLKMAQNMALRVRKD
jgi:transcriptional regulator with XRE-family HTH domain